MWLAAKWERDNLKLYIYIYICVCVCVCVYVCVCVCDETNRRMQFDMISHVLTELRVFSINISKQKSSTMTLRLLI